MHHLTVDIYWRITGTFAAPTMVSYLFLFAFRSPLCRHTVAKKNYVHIATDGNAQRVYQSTKIASKFIYADRRYKKKAPCEWASVSVCGEVDR